MAANSKIVPLLVMFTVPIGLVIYHHSETTKGEEVKIIRLFYSMTLLFSYKSKFFYSKLKTLD